MLQRNATPLLSPLQVFLGVDMSNFVTNKNSNLSKAKNAKNDEFYTQYHDIEKEMQAYLDYDPDVFRNTTNTIESLNASLRKVTSTKRTFPNDDAVFKIIYMVLINTMQKWTMPIKDWKPAMRQFVMLYGHRVEGY